jgi:hypothetical protein
VVVTWSQEIREWPVLELEKDMPVLFNYFALPASHSRLTSRKEIGSDARSTDDSMVVGLCAYEGGNSYRATQRVVCDMTKYSRV